MTEKTLSRLSTALAPILLAAVLVAPAGAETTYSYVSECFDVEGEIECDPVGGGDSETLTDADGEWSIRRGDDNSVQIDFEHPGFFDDWEFDFAAPGDVEIIEDTYLGAERYPFQDPSNPGMSVRKNAGCNALTGEFTVLDVEYDWFGEPLRFTVDFDQTCDQFVPSLLGDLTHTFDGVLGSATLTPGNLLVTWEERLFEFTQDGTLVQPIPIRRAPGPHPGTVPSVGEFARDVVVDANGNVHIFIGRFSPQLSTFLTAIGIWRYDTVADWLAGSHLSDGGLATQGQYVYVADQGNPDTSGIIRFDMAADYNAERFALDNDYDDLAMGFDGKLYAMIENTLDSDVDIYDPETMALLGSVTLDDDVNAIAVNAAGEIFGASDSGLILRFDAAGVTQDSVPTFEDLLDIDLNRSGQIAVSTRFDEVFLTTEALGSTTSFRVDFGNNVTFVAFVQSPPAPILQAGGFESGDTSAWSGSSGAAGGFLDVNSGAARNGNFGLEVTVGGSCSAENDLVISGPTTSGTSRACNSIAAGGVQVVDPGATFEAGTVITLEDEFSVATSTPFTATIDAGLVTGFAYVEDDSPSSETHYSARFDLRLDDLQLVDGDELHHLVAYSNSGQEQFRVALKLNSTLDENRLLLAARQDDGSFVDTAGEEILLPTPGWNTIQVTWKAGAGDGRFLVSVNGAPFTGLTGLDNDTGRIGSVRWGAVNGTITTSTGSLDVDDFSSWR